MTPEPDIDHIYDNNNVISIPRRMNHIETASTEFITARKEADRLLDTLEYYIYNSRKYPTTTKQIIIESLTACSPASSPSALPSMTSSRFYKNTTPYKTKPNFIKLLKLS